MPKAKDCPSREPQLKYSSGDPGYSRTLTFGQTYEGRNIGGVKTKEEKDAQS